MSCMKKIFSILITILLVLITQNSNIKCQDLTTEASGKGGIVAAGPGIIAASYGFR